MASTRPCSSRSRKVTTKVLPQIARTGVTNFFANLGMVVTTFNDAIQLKGEKVPVDIIRVATNLTFGLFGLIDVATELGIENRNEDFGQTLGYWGVGSGPYLVLPLLGPANVRDGAGLAVDFVVSPYFYVENDKAGVLWGLLAVNVVDTRANLLPAEKILDESGVERYTFLRDVYLKRRQYLIHDGNPPVVDHRPAPEDPARAGGGRHDGRAGFSCEAGEAVNGATAVKIVNVVNTSVS